MAHKTSLKSPLFIEVPVPSRENEQSYIFVLGIDYTYNSMIFLLDFGTIQAVIVYSLVQSFLAKNIESADTTVNLISTFLFC